MKQLYQDLLRITRTVVRHAERALTRTRAAATPAQLSTTVDSSGACWHKPEPACSTAIPLPIAQPVSSDTASSAREADQTDGVRTVGEDPEAEAQIHHRLRGV